MLSFNHTIIDNQGPGDIWLKVVGDVNGDGLSDLVAGGNSSGGLVWYENPSWTKHTIDSTGEFGTDGDVLDVDRDGDQDVVVLTSNDIRWYENPGWTVHVIENRKLHDLEASDFDGDGDMDLVARDQGEFGHVGNELHFYRQNTPSSWTHRAVSCPNGEGLDVADVDRDGDQDVVINGRWFENTKNILNGAWTDYTYTSSWTHPNAFVSTGDINQDGRVDIVLAPAELAGGTYRISWFTAPLNPKNANWTEHIVENNVETVQHFVGVADMDNDGDMDIAAAEMQQGSNPDEVKVYLNGDGSGETWQKQVIATTGSHSMRILDVEKDGDQDLYGANWQDNQLELWENQTCQQELDHWQRHVIDSGKPWRAVFITAADMDQDGLQDIITGGWWYKNPGSPSGVWTRKTIGSPLNNMAAVRDFDGDGLMDVLGTLGQGSDPDPRFVWARNLGSGSFNILSNIEQGEGDFLQGVAVGHVQSGGGLKVGLSWHASSNGLQMLSVPTNPLVNSWTMETISPTSQDEALSMGDIDRDGDQDLLLGTIWLEKNGSSWNDHLLHETSGSPYGESDPDRNRLADINKDGRLDAVVGYEAISVEGKLAWYEQGNAATGLWQEHVIANVVGPMSLDVGDVDRDGDLDVVVGEHNLDDPASARLIVFENVDRVGTQWQEHLVYQGDEHHDGAQLVDIDGDGDLDIISIGWNHAQVVLYEYIKPFCGFSSPSFGDVPIDHPYFEHIEVLYANGLTNGCSTTELLYCPTMIMNRAQVAKFFMTAEYGGSYLPPSNTPLAFKDSWKINPWAKLWANDMYAKGLTNGCSASPLRYCPDDQVIREQVAKFGLAIKYGNAYIPPPATGTVFADLTDPKYWATAWAEQAYADGLVPACGTVGGKPKFCPYGKVDRGFAAFVIVTATGLLGP